MFQVGTNRGLRREPFGHLVVGPHRGLEVVEALGRDEEGVRKVVERTHAVARGRDQLRPHGPNEDVQRFAAIGGQVISEGGGDTSTAVEQLEILEPVQALSEECLGVEVGLVGDDVAGDALRDVVGEGVLQRLRHPSSLPSTRVVIPSSLGRAGSRSRSSTPRFVL